LRLGYRLIDTARSYGNEDCVGSALIESSVSRDLVTIVSKVQPQEFLHEGGVDKALTDTLLELRTEYLDVLLLHQSAGEREWDRTWAAWQLLSAHKAQGRIRALGVSNFNLEEIEKLRIAIQGAGAATIDFVEAKWSVFHRGWFWNPQGDNLAEYCKRHGIHLLGFRAILAEGHSPPITADPHLETVAAQLGDGISAAMVGLRFALQSPGVWGILAKPSTARQLEENWRVYTNMPALHEEQMARLDALAALLRSPTNRADRSISCNVFGV